jgi:hypothetical protein
MVPAYAYPTAGGVWDKLATAAKVVHVEAILNPNNGPGSARDSNYAAAVNHLRAAGGAVIGYVPTDYAKVPLAKVEAEIKDYHLWYHIDGIFIDEMTSDASQRHRTNETTPNPYAYLPKYWSQLVAAESAVHH